jgi:cytochrome P450
MDVRLPKSGDSNGVRYTRFGPAGLLKCQFELSSHCTVPAANADDYSVLTTPTHAVQFFRNSHRHTKAVNNDSGWLFGEVLGVCVGLLSGSDWKRVRQQVEDGFSRPTAARYTADLVTLAREYLQSTLLASSEQSLETKRIIHVEPAKTLQFYPFMAVAQILFGRLSPMQRTQLTTLAPLREELFKEVIRGGINRLPIAPWFRSRGVRLLNEFQTQWEQFVEDAYHAAVKRNQSPRPLVIGLWEAYQAGTISKREVSACLDGSFGCSDSYSACKLSTNRSTLIWTSPHMPSRGMCCC